MSQRIVIGGGFPLDVTQSYTYDELNRLKTASEAPSGGGLQTWQQSYDYDRWGNRAVNPGSLTIPDPILTLQSLTDFDTSNNRIQKAGFGYDDNGNLTRDPTTSANALVYDGENKLVSYTKGGITTSYSYDGDGNRVKKESNGLITVFVYNAGKQLIAEYSNSTAPPADGGGTSYLTTDHLGSTRVVTRQDGNAKARYDYLPFGEELGLGIAGRSVSMGYGGPDGTRQKFTQKERDSESGLDYFLARYYSPAQGRFASADSIMGRISSPQSLNLYCYTFNNPLAYVDPTGHSPEQKEKQMTLEFNATAAAAVARGEATYADYGLGGVLNEQISVLAPPDHISSVPSFIPSFLRHTINFGDAEAAITADHSATGPNVAIGQVMNAYIAVGSFLATSGASSWGRLAFDVALEVGADKAFDRLVVGGETPLLSTGDVSLNNKVTTGADVIGDINAAPFQSGTFKEVFFERVQFTSFTGNNIGALDEATRVLQPGGRLTITTGRGCPPLAEALRQRGFTEIDVRRTTGYIITALSKLR